MNLDESIEIALVFIGIGGIGSNPSPQQKICTLASQADFIVTWQQPGQDSDGGTQQYLMIFVVK